MVGNLEYSKLYTFEEAAKVLGVSLKWTQRWVSNAISTGMISNKNGKDEPVLVSGADLKTVAMKRWAQLESEYHWNAFNLQRAREQGRPMDGEADNAL
jgi:transposase